MRDVHLKIRDFCFWPPSEKPLQIQVDAKVVVAANNPSHKALHLMWNWYLDAKVYIWFKSANGPFGDTTTM